MDSGHRVEARAAGFGGLAGWGPVIAIIALSALVALGGDDARALLRYERGALAAGEPWRWLSAHFTHLRWAHVATNMAAVVLIHLIARNALRTIDWVGVTVTAALAIDVGLQLFSAHVDWYVGFSGVSHGLLAAAALALRPGRPVLAVVMFAGLAAKLVWEQVAGAVPGSAATAGGAVIVDAHLYGAVAGVAWWAGRHAGRRISPRDAASL